VDEGKGSQLLSVVEEDRLIYSALLGISTIAVIQLASVGQMDASLFFSLACFSVAIPLAAGKILALGLELKAGCTAATPFSRVSQILAASGSLLGIGGMFCHFSSWLGFAFLASCAWAIALVLHISRKVNSDTYR
jgi:hypothetical protein